MSVPDDVGEEEDDASREPVDDTVSAGEGPSSRNSRAFESARARTLPSSFSSTSLARRVALDAPFDRKSAAPARIASIVTSAPFSVRELSMRMGRGDASMMWRTASMPFIFGISTSIVTTSGSSRRAFSTPASPFVAVSTTVVSSACSKIREMAFRITNESSTTSTRIIAIERDQNGGDRWNGGLLRGRGRHPVRVGGLGAFLLGGKFFVLDHLPNVEHHDDLAVAQDGGPGNARHRLEVVAQ